MDVARSREKWHERLSRVINSTVCFSLAYVVITYLFWLVMGFAGKLFKFDSFVRYYDIKYILNDYDWSQLRITFVYSSGPFFCLALGLFCLFLFNKLKAYRVIFNIFVLWGFIIGTSIFTSQAIIACLGANKYLSPFYQNFAVVYAWWHVPVAVVYILAIPLLIAFLYFSVNYAKPFLITAHSYSKVNSEGRRKMYFIETAIVPFILGAVITSAVTYPMNIRVHGVYMMMIAAALMIGWFSLVYIKIPKEEVLKYQTLQSPNPLFFFLLFLAISFVYIGWKGVNLHVK